VTIDTDEVSTGVQVFLLGGSWSGGVGGKTPDPNDVDSVNKVQPADFHDGCQWSVRQ
jgi:hypothetical protein